MITPPILPADPGDPTLVAFYLPQFHPIPENDRAWGPGFTEWTNVARARPNFEGHYQPHIPRDLGFYDLRLPEVMRQQAELAKSYGLGAFCFYYYWFSGRRVLELPLANWLNADIEFPFCICWANENWTRRWDGGSGEVLLEQLYSTDDFVAFFEAVLPILRDRRYLHVGGKPILNVYRPLLFPDARRVADLWRRLAAEAGLPGLHLCAVEFYGVSDPASFGFDALIEFPPHGYLSRDNLATGQQITNPNFSGVVTDYRKIIAQSLDRKMPSHTVYRGVLPSWDNTPRRQDDPFIVDHARPELFHYWLSRIVAWSRQHQNREDRLVFINAWNEWGEGCHLEPDLKFGLQYLEACLAAKTTDATEAELINSASRAADGALQIIAPPHPFGATALDQEIDLARWRRDRWPAGRNAAIDFGSSLVRRLLPGLHTPLRRVFHRFRGRRG